MPVEQRLWTVGEKPVRLRKGTLPDERTLENMIVAESGILSDEWMLIGRQEGVEGGGRVDLLAIAPDGSLVLIELKRDRTTRDVIAQMLDYASWLTGLDSGEVAAIYGRFRDGRSLREDFKEKFGRELDEKEVNRTHQLVVVASSIDPRTERVIRYLASRDVPINLLAFEVFAHDGDTQLLSRAWMLDPVEAQANASFAAGDDREPWNGEFYACFGHGDARSWDEAVQHGFLSAGGGAWYSGTLRFLEPGSRVWVKAPGYGFVGVGLATGIRESAVDFTIGGRPALEVLGNGHYHGEFSGDGDQMEYFVPIRWLDHVAIDHGVNEVGLFGNQNTVCRPTTPKWRITIGRLKVAFPNFDRMDKDAVG